jgi:hypothetical protein
MAVRFLCTLNGLINTPTRSSRASVPLMSQQFRLLLRRGTAAAIFPAVRLSPRPHHLMAYRVVSAISPSDITL